MQGPPPFLQETRKNLESQRLWNKAGQREQGPSHPVSLAVLLEHALWGKAAAFMRETSGRYGASSHFSQVLLVSLAAGTLRTRTQESSEVLSRADR